LNLSQVDVTCRDHDSADSSVASHMVNGKNAVSWPAFISYHHLPARTQKMCIVMQSINAMHSKILQRGARQHKTCQGRQGRCNRPRYCSCVFARSPHSTLRWCKGCFHTGSGMAGDVAGTLLDTGSLYMWVHSTRRLSTRLSSM